MRFGTVLADAGYGICGEFRRALTDEGLLWAVGIISEQKLYPVNARARMPRRRRWVRGGFTRCVRARAAPPKTSPAAVNGLGAASPGAPAVSASAAPEAGPVDAALAAAPRAATSAGRWKVVAQLACELEARRSARAGNVVRFSGGLRGQSRSSPSVTHALSSVPNRYLRKYVWDRPEKTPTIIYFGTKLIKNTCRSLDGPDCPSVCW